MKRHAMEILLVISLFWSGMTLTFDAFLVLPGVRQFMSRKYLMAEGTVLSSEVEQKDNGDEGTVSKPSIRYEYTADGTRYVGDKFSYEGVSSTTCDCDSVQEIVAQHPKGSRVPVFYNPRHPQDSVLDTEFHGRSLFYVTFMTPFNVAMIGIWEAVVLLARRKFFKLPAGGIKIIRKFRKLHARMTFISPVMAVLWMIAALAFAGVFIVGPFNGFSPSLQTMKITWAIILSGGVVGGVWQARRISSGHYDLVIDDLENILELPATLGRKKRRRVAFAEIKRIWVDTIVHRDSEGASETFAPTLTISGAQPVMEKLAKWSDEQQAREFVDWLRSQIPKSPVQRPLAGNF